ncbi:quinone oxidoreductase-like protein 2 [Neodiprion lecontei]|uniref:Quinone oxidoreductase-like protein 2 n=1 Tax=Neodiprion lecontei TaxID=441921 RepID=A0A6J0BJF8_NEOLC|nr:quinone oxidoreductase-like protein 2 [Neodiprion lecontei]
MSAAFGRRVVSQLFAKTAKRSCIRLSTSKWRSTTAVASETVVADKPSKNVIPAPEPGRVQAALLKNFDEPLQIENIDAPRITEDKEVLIDVHYCALNGPDILLSKNSYPHKLKLPQILGYEIVGELREIGDHAAKAGYKVGDKVIALNKQRFGGFAETCTAEFGDIWKVPNSLKLIDAVCLLDGYATALVGFEKRACLQEDDMVLVNVGLGGVGLAAVDLAANVYRAQVIGVCATEDRTTLVREKGAFAALKFHDKKLMKQIVNVAAEKDIKEIFDGVSGENFKKVLSCFTDVYKSGLVKDLLHDNEFSVVIQHLSREGRVIVAGLAVSKYNGKDAAPTGSFGVTGVSLHEYRDKDHEFYRSVGDEVLEFFEDGLISPSRSLVAGLYKINSAMKFILKMKASGKVVIDMKNKEVFTETDDDD